MNRLRLLEYNSERVIYQYIPEDEGDPGEIIFDFSDGEAKVAKRAQNDEHGGYGFKAARRVTEYVQKKNLPLDSIQAWY